MIALITGLRKVWGQGDFQFYFVQLPALTCAVIDGNSVVVSCPEVQQPVAVHYAYNGNPSGCNLYNKDDLPASPFRTED